MSAAETDPIPEGYAMLRSASQGVRLFIVGPFRGNMPVLVTEPSSLSHAVLP